MINSFNDIETFVPTIYGRNEFLWYPVFVSNFGLQNYNPIRISIHKCVVLDRKNVKDVTKSSVVAVLGDI